MFGTNPLAFAAPAAASGPSCSTCRPPSSRAARSRSTSARASRCPTAGRWTRPGGPRAMRARCSTTCRPAPAAASSRWAVGDGVQRPQGVRSGRDGRYPVRRAVRGAVRAGRVRHADLLGTRQPLLRRHRDRQLPRAAGLPARHGPHARQLRESPLAEGEERVYFAGLKEFEQEEESARRGVPLLAKTLPALRRSGRRSHRGSPDAGRPRGLTPWAAGARPASTGARSPPQCAAMDIDALALDLEKTLRGIPLLDAHTHLDATHLAARGLHDVLLYHMVVSDLVSAGCPDRERLPEQPSDEEARIRIERALPYLPAIANTSCAWGLRIILADLYGWREPVTRRTGGSSTALIRERSADPAWTREILRGAGIRRSCTELWRRHDGEADDLLQYSLEWSFFARRQWGEYDTASVRAGEGVVGGHARRPVAGDQGGGPARARADDPHRRRRARRPRRVRRGHPSAGPEHGAAHLHRHRLPRGGRADHGGRAAPPPPGGHGGARHLRLATSSRSSLRRLESRRPGVVFQFSLGAEPLPVRDGEHVSTRRPLRGWRA